MTPWGWGRRYFEGGHWDQPVVWNVKLSVCPSVCVCHTPGRAGPDRPGPTRPGDYPARPGPARFLPEILQPGPARSGPCRALVSTQACSQAGSKWSDDPPVLKGDFSANCVSANILNTVHLRNRINKIEYNYHVNVCFDHKVTPSIVIIVKILDSHW